MYYVNRIGRYLGKCARVALVLALVLLSVESALATNINGKPVMQQSDPTGENYFANRRALVGRYCTVNRIGAGIGVAAGMKDLPALTNEDLTDYVTLPAVANVDAGAKQYVSVRDVAHYYAKGTQVGFALSGNSGANVLQVDLVKFYKINFYRDGTNVGEASVDDGKSVGVLKVALVNLPGDSSVNVNITAEAPEDFDEIELVQYGVEATVVTALHIKYAFVGEARLFTLTAEGTGDDDSKCGMTSYETYLAQNGRNTSIELDAIVGSHQSHSDAEMIDADLTNKRVVQGALFNDPAKISAIARDGKETFAKGTVVGVKYNAVTALLKLELSKSKLELLDKDGNVVSDNDISMSLLALQIGGEDRTISITAPCDFSQVRVTMPYSVNVGLASVYYAFVQLPVEKEHTCNIAPSSDVNLCCETQYQLTAQGDNLTWTIVSQPEKGQATVDSTGLVEGLGVDGAYVIAVSSSDCPNDPKCVEYVTINYGIDSYDPADHGETMWINASSEDEQYTLSEDAGGGLIALGKLHNSYALTNSETRDYAYTKASVDLAANSQICGVKSATAVTATDAGMEVGFVVSAPSNALGADLLNFFTISLKKDGKEINSKYTNKVIDRGYTLSADLIGSKDENKVRYAITVDDEVSFDEITLWSSGVLSLSLKQLNIYYAYTATTDGDYKQFNATTGAQLVSMETTGAYISDRSKSAALVAAGTGLIDLYNIISSNTENAFHFNVGAEVAAGDAVGVKLGRIVTPGQQIIVATDQKNVLLGADLANVVQLKLYYNDEAKGDEADWSVLGADVLGGSNDLGYLTFTATDTIDEVVIISGEGIQALEALKIYAIYIANDADGDGIPDGIDTDVCGSINDLVLDEDVSLFEKHKTRGDKDYEKATLFFHRTFVGSQKNALTLPVALTANQVREAFGKDVRLSTLNDETGAVDVLSDTGKEIGVYLFIKDDEISLEGKTTEVVIEPNKTYLITPSVDEVNRHGEDITILTGDGTVSGPVYMATGVALTWDNVATANPEEKHSHGFLEGTYTTDNHINGNSTSNAAPRRIASSQSYYNFMFGSANPLAILTGQTDIVKAYNGWFREAGSAISTNIDDIAVDVLDSNAPIYNMMGQRMDRNNLAPGVYITQGRKFVVKQ